MQSDLGADDVRALLHLTAYTSARLCSAVAGGALTPPDTPADATKVALVTALSESFTTCQAVLRRDAFRLGTESHN
jgi:hypothetical protein